MGKKEPEGGSAYGNKQGSGGGNLIEEG